MSALAPASPPGRLHGGDEDATKLISIQMHYRRFQIDCKYFNFIYFLLRESSNTREDYRKRRRGCIAYNNNSIGIQSQRDI